MNKFTVSRRGLLSAGVAASAASLASSVFAQEMKSSWSVPGVPVLQPQFLPRKQEQK